MARIKNINIRNLTPGSGPEGAVTGAEERWERGRYTVPRKAVVPAPAVAAAK